MGGGRRAGKKSPAWAFARSETPLKPQEIDGPAGLSLQGQIRQDFPHQGCELEPVAGKTGSKNHLLELGMAVDDEVAVGRQGVETGLCGHHLVQRGAVRVQ